VVENSNNTSSEADQGSPRWNWSTKLIFGLVLVVLAIWLLVQFKNFLGTIILAFIIAYLFYPVANLLQKYIKLRWRIAVFLIYLIVVLALLALLTWGGLALVDQIQNLIVFIQNNIEEIPQLIKDFTQNTYTIGTFEFTLSGLNWDEITKEIIGAIEPIISRVGNIAGTLASGAASVVLNIGLILLISYFILTETEGIPNQFLTIRIPGYTADLKRMGRELSNIWNAFIRGQIVVVLITIIIYTTFLGSMGIEFFFGLALVAALGRFVPYVGAWITWITYGLVALLQGHTIFGLPTGIYAIIVLGISMLIDTLLDNLLVPKVMSENLKVHPALVLIGALIAVDLLGIIGILLAAPVLATLKLVFGYIYNKMVDQDPWEEIDNREPEEKPKWVVFIEKQWMKFTAWVSKLWKKNKLKLEKKRSKVRKRGSRKK
jgi:predicted PurR-regulated permease PerM